jgi:hypothetical protein
MTEQFDSRVANVFAALDEHDPNEKRPEWRMRDYVAASPGAPAGECGSDDSDEDEASHTERVEVRLTSPFLSAIQVKMIMMGALIDAQRTAYSRTSAWRVFLLALESCFPSVSVKDEHSPPECS